MFLEGFYHRQHQRGIRSAQPNFHDCAEKAESLKFTKRRLSLETFELISQRGAAGAAGNHQLASELAKRYREALKEDLKQRREAVLAEATEAGQSTRNASRDFANHKAGMTALRCSDTTITAIRRMMEKVILNFYSDLFDSRVHLPSHHLREDDYVAPAVLPSEIRHAIKSVKNGTAPGPDKVRPVSKESTTSPHQHTGHICRSATY